MLPGEADPEPARRQGSDVLPRLRLTRIGPSTPNALLLTVASAIILAAANPPLDLGPLAFVALAPLVWVLRGRPLRGMFLSVAFGLVYYGLLLSWLLPFGLIAWLPLVVLEALYLALFGGLVPRLWHEDRPVLSALAVAALWTTIEWFRGAWPLGGFTWGGVGYTQHDNPLLLPLASVTGVWGVTFVVVMVNALLVGALASVRGRSGERGDGLNWSRVAVLAVVAVAGTAGPALIPLLEGSSEHPGLVSALDVAVVQGNVPRAVGDELTRFGLQSRAVTENHVRLHRTLATDPPMLAVWPENSLDLDVVPDADLESAVRDSLRSVGAPALIGGVTESPEGVVRNQVLSFSPTGQIQGRYTKTHLVPFGEYVPFRRFLGWVDQLRAVPRDIQAGDDITTFQVQGVRVGTPICFENTFPDVFRRFVAQGAELMIVTTNDSAYARSPASREHVIMSELRAVETRRWVVQAAISGISAVVDPQGNVMAETGLFEQAVLRWRVPTSTVRTIYTRLGDWFPAVCLIGVALMLPWSIRRAQRGRGRDAGSVEPGTPPAGEGTVAHADASGPSGRRTPQPIAGAGHPRTIVILPTYNERETVGKVISGVLANAPAADVLVVDDASPDGTGDLIEEVAGRDPRVHLLRRSGKLGLSSAYLAGFRFAFERGYDVIVEMDADLSHRPEDLPRLLEAAASHDLVIGSRYVAGGGVVNWSRARLGLSRVGNAYARTALRFPLTDATSGFRAFRRHVLESLLEERVTSEGYAFQIELAYRAWRAGFSVVEVPITFRERAHGRSKISRRIVAEAMWRVGVWGVRDRFARARRDHTRTP